MVQLEPAVRGSGAARILHLNRERRRRRKWWSAADQAGARIQSEAGRQRAAHDAVGVPAGDALARTSASYRVGPPGRWRSARRLRQRSERQPACRPKRSWRPVAFCEVGCTGHSPGEGAVRRRCTADDPVDGLTTARRQCADDAVGVGAGLAGGQNLSADRGAYLRVHHRGANNRNGRRRNQGAGAGGRRGRVPLVVGDLHAPGERPEGRRRTADSAVAGFSEGPPAAPR